MEKNTAKKTVSMNLDQARKMRPVGEVSEQGNARVVSFMNTLLANEYALFTKTLKYHWNVTGLVFHSLHAFLDGQYRELLEVMDHVAERIRVLDAVPLSTVAEVHGRMELSENPGEVPEAKKMLNDLLRDHLTVQSEIKEIVAEEDLWKDDPGTQDFLIGLIGRHETMSWMLKAHLK